MTRLTRGWLLTKASWAVVRRDRTLLMFPVIAAYGALIVAAIFISLAFLLHSYTGSEPLTIAVVALGVYVFMVVNAFCTVALSACAARSLDGHDTTVIEGILLAQRRLGTIFGWALVQLSIGALTALIEVVVRQGAGALVARLVGGLTNLAWSAASFFVLPVIALEGLPPAQAVKRSTEIIRERWGEGVVGTASISGLMVLLIFLPGLAMIIGGITLRRQRPVSGAILAGLGAVTIIVGVIVQTALTATFRIALYRFASEGKVPGGFEPEALETAFTPRRRRLG
jgi:hypothetical protein